MTTNRLVWRIKERIDFDKDITNVFFVKNGQLVAFTDDNWDEFISSVVVRKKDCTKWGLFKVILTSAHPDTQKCISRGKSNTPKTDSEEISNSVKQEDDQQFAMTFCEDNVLATPTSPIFERRHVESLSTPVENTNEDEFEYRKVTESLFDEIELMMEEAGDI